METIMISRIVRDGEGVWECWSSLGKKNSFLSDREVLYFLMNFSRMQEEKGIQMSCGKDKGNDVITIRKL